MVDTEKEQEIWKVFPKSPFVEVSNLGRVRTKDRWVTQKMVTDSLLRGEF